MNDLGIYRQHDRLRPKVRKGGCMATVYDRWRIDVVGHQCTSKAVVQVGEYGFCRLHAKKYKTEAAGPHELD